MAALRGIDLARAFLRSFWLQGSWSFEGMQTLGFAYAVEPALKRLHDAGEARKEALQRHLEFFNTNPLLASAILGCVIRLEEEGGTDVAETVREIKTSLMGPYGAIGDSLCWGALKPLLILLALLAAYRGALWAPAVFVLVFVAVNVGGRLYGFWQGYRKGLGVVGAVSRLNLILWARRIKGTCAVLLGVLLASAAGPTLLEKWETPALLWVPAAWFLATGAAWVIGKGVPPVWLVYLATVVSLGVVACT